MAIEKCGLFKSPRQSCKIKKIKVIGAFLADSHASVCEILVLTFPFTFSFLSSSSST